MTSRFSLKLKVLSSLQYRVGVSLFRSGIAGWSKLLHDFAMKQLQRASHKHHTKAQQLMASLLIYRGETILDKRAGVSLLEGQAQAGDAQAQFLLAETMVKGQISLMGDESSALSWYLAAAQQGHAMAALRLSKAYKAGELGLKQDEQQAHNWLQQFMQHSQNMSFKK